MWYNSTFCRNGFPLCYIDILKAVANKCFNKIKVTTKKLRDWLKKTEKSVITFHLGLGEQILALVYGFYNIWQIMKHILLILACFGLD